MAVAAARPIRFNGSVSATDPPNDAVRAILEAERARRQALKSAIESGEYRVDCDAVAGAIVARLLEREAAPARQSD